MRVLFTTTPGRGHWQPMLPLADALVVAGHELHWAAAEDVCERLRKRGFSATRCGIGGEEAAQVVPPPEVAALPLAERPNHMFARIFGPRRAEPMLADLVAIVERLRPDLMVCDQAELASPIAAARAGVPNVTHGFGRLLPEPRVARAQDAMADHWRAHGLEPRPYGGTYDHLFLDIYPPSLQTPDTAHVGARLLLRPAEAAVPGGSEPLVYITFGTVFNEDLTLFATAVEAARDVPLRIVVTLGPGHAPDALGPQPPNVTVAEYIPQETLLGDCVAVISHGGSGTFLAALAAGVPQVVLPQAADQFLNAESADRGGVGVALLPDVASVPNVRMALERVLEGGEMRTAAQRVAAEIAAMPSPAVVADELARRYG